MLGVPARANSSDHPGVRTTLYVLLVSDLLIVLRTLFRLAESAEGTFSSTMTNQVSSDHDCCAEQTRGTLYEPMYGAYRCRETKRMKLVLVACVSRRVAPCVASSPLFTIATHPYPTTNPGILPIQALFVALEMIPVIIAVALWALYPLGRVFPAGMDDRVAARGRRGEKMDGLV